MKHGHSGRPITGILRHTNGSNKLVSHFNRTVEFATPGVSNAKRLAQTVGSRRGSNERNQKSEKFDASSINHYSSNLGLHDGNRMSDVVLYADS